VPVEPLVPKKPEQKLITDESASGTWVPAASVINSTVISNVTVTTANESIVLMSSAAFSFVSTLAVLSAAAVILYLVSYPASQFYFLCYICCFSVCSVNF